MKSVKAWARVEWWAELPENDSDADAAFDEACDAIDAVLNATTTRIPYALGQSFSIADADAEPDE